jgi:hypothetical protein
MKEFKGKYVGENLKERFQINKYYNDTSIDVDELYTNCGVAYCFFWATLETLYINFKKFYDVSKLGITDGYWLVFLSPLVILWWILFTLLIAPIFILLGILYGLAFFWAIVFELPSDVLNSKKIKALKEKYLEECELVYGENGTAKKDNDNDYTPAEPG